jgi:hypothetical protein
MHKTIYFEDSWQNHIPTSKHTLRPYIFAGKKNVIEKNKTHLIANNYSMLRVHLLT